MKLEHWKDVSSFDTHIHVTLSDADMIVIYPELLSFRFRIQYEAFNRADASIEEKLMLLQIYARILEEKAENEKAPKVS